MSHVLKVGQMAQIIKTAVKASILWLVFQFIKVSFDNLCVPHNKKCANQYVVYKHESIFYKICWADVSLCVITEYKTSDLK